MVVVVVVGVVVVGFVVGVCVVSVGSGSEYGCDIGVVVKEGSTEGKMV